MSSSRNGRSQLKSLAVVPISGNKEPATRGVQPSFDGMIASACDLGIRLEDFIEMARMATMNDAGIARFLDAWDALSASEQQARGMADAVCARIGLAPADLLKVVADAAVRFAISGAQLGTALALPSVVEHSIEVALTDKGIADRRMLLLHSGFLPGPKNGQTGYLAKRSAQGNTPEQLASVPAPSPELTIRRLADRFNDARAVPPAAQATCPQEDNE